jgi:WD40 repeat protein
LYSIQSQAAVILRSTRFVANKGRIVGITEDWKGAVWDLNGVQTAVFDGTSLGTGAPVSYLSVAPDLLTAFVAYDDGSTLFVDGHKHVTGRFEKDPGQITSAAFSPDGSTLVTAGSGGAAIWSRDGALVKQLEASPPVAYAIFSPTGTRIAVASYDGSVSLWDGNGNLVSRLRLASAESRQSPTQLQTGIFTVQRWRPRGAPGALPCGSGTEPQPTNISPRSTLSSARTPSS